MKVSKLVAMLLAQDQDADVTIYSGWDGPEYMSVKGMNHYPDGYQDHSANTVLIHSHNNPPSAGRKPARKVPNAAKEE